MTELACFYLQTLFPLAASLGCIEFWGWRMQLISLYSSMVCDCNHQLNLWFYVSLRLPWRVAHLLTDHLPPPWGSPCSNSMSKQLEICVAQKQIASIKTFKYLFKNNKQRKNVFMHPLTPHQSSTRKSKATLK